MAVKSAGLQERDAATYLRGRSDDLSDEGSVSVKKLSHLCRMLGLTVTEKELDNLVQAAAVECGGGTGSRQRVTVEELVNFLFDLGVGKSASGAGNAKLDVDVESADHGHVRPPSSASAPETASCAAAVQSAQEALATSNPSVGIGGCASGASEVADTDAAEPSATAAAISFSAGSSARSSIARMVAAKVAATPESEVTQ
eukprot:TRINITY_DN38848_c0_g1_i1.p1 TRINITY_DN38848_c0_g1~~TRINITY_DN38848_c0_g1_i1.p1  ORF type:complete len:200 (+),score=44.15 TRINITY_DN38848_c0_g1_i1:138-737(+)